MPPEAPVTTTTGAVLDLCCGSHGCCSYCWCSPEGRSRESCSWGREGDCADSMRRAWTNAWGRLPRSWRWTTSNSSVNRPGWAECTAVALEPAHGLEVMTLLMGGQCHVETAQQERTLCVGERTGLLAEAVDVAVLAQLLANSGQGGGADGGGGWHGSSQGGQQERGVDPLVVGRALPATRRVAGCRGGSSNDLVGQPSPPRGVRPRAGASVGTQAGRAEELRVRPLARVELPDARVRLASPPRRDDPSSDQSSPVLVRGVEAGSGPRPRTAAAPRRASRAGTGR